MDKDQAAKWRELRRVADLINMEFKTDPRSVACFDIRIVREFDAALAAVKDLEP